MSQDWGGSASTSSGRDQNEWEIPHRLDWCFCWQHNSENYWDYQTVSAGMNYVWVALITPSFIFFFNATGEILILISVNRQRRIENDLKHRIKPAWHQFFKASRWWYLSAGAASRCCRSRWSSSFSWRRSWSCSSKLGPSSVRGTGRTWPSPPSHRSASQSSSRPRLRPSRRCGWRTAGTRTSSLETQLGISGLMWAVAWRQFHSQWSETI